MSQTLEPIYSGGLPLQRWTAPSEQLDILTLTRLPAALSAATVLQSPALATAKPFLCGSVAGCFATCCIQPMDMVKMRVQLNPTLSPVSVAKSIFQKEGASAMYTGLSAALTRQIVYTGSRMGLYDTLCERAKERSGEQTLPLLTTSACALAAGGLAAVIGNPADVSLIRMQADSLLPPAARRGYTSIVTALASIVRHEGLGGLLSGAGPTATRAMSLNLGMFVGNSEAEKHLRRAGLEGDRLVFGSSAIAGFLASACSLPFDYVKTMMQKQVPDARGALPHSSSLACALHTLREGGLTRFYSGFSSYYFRIAPHAMLTLIAANKIKQVWKAL